MFFRFKSGNQIIVGNGGNSEALVEILSISKNCIEGKILRVWKNENELHRKIILFLFDFKKKKTLKQSFRKPSKSVFPR